VDALAQLQTRLGWTFRDPQWLRLALTHPSTNPEQRKTAEDNQRLEFLGDAVLGMVLTRELFVRFPGYGEGPLTKARAHLVNRRFLAELARRLELGPCLILSHGEEASGGRSRSSTLADAFEAIVGAVFMDGGLEAVTEVIQRCYEGVWSGVAALPRIHNPKGELQEYLQSSSDTPPLYTMTASSGPDHDRMFECAVLHEGRELGRGRGKSKKAAETEAALAALAKLRAPPKTGQPTVVVGEAESQSPGLSDNPI